MARRYLGIGHAEWHRLPWHIRQAYLEGMEADESVPLTFERQGPEVPDVVPGMQVRGTPPAEVIDITGMIGELEAGRRAGRR